MRTNNKPSTAVITQRTRLSRYHPVKLTRVFLVVGLLFSLVPTVHALVVPPGGGGTNSGPTYTPLNSWSFQDSVGWTSDTGKAPISFTNLAFSNLGNGASLVVDTNVPAWLQYNVYENDGSTNLTVNSGTIMFWVAPSSWASTNVGGNGPGEAVRLLEVGGYTPNSSFGWWSVYVDSGGNNLYFSAQTNDLAGTVTTYLSCPISWTTNYFHHVALVYSSTNTALFIDGGLASSGPPMTVYPGPQALANGFCIGSDTNGIYQSQASFNSVVTYGVPVDAGTIQQTFNQEFPYYMMNPLNRAMFTLTNAISSPSWTNGFDAITGVGNLQWNGYASVCTYGANPYQVWFTNVTALATNGGTSLTFSIEGGQPGYYYDVFATGALQNPFTNSVFVWLGQGQTCNTYTVNVISQNAFFVLGTPWSSCGCGMTDAYLSLVAKVSPDGPQTDSYGVPYAWYAENGLVPITAGLATQDPDADGLLNYQEYFYGTRPNVSEGFSIWIAAINGTSIIP